VGAASQYWAAPAGFLLHLQAPTVGPVGRPQLPQGGLVWEPAVVLLARKPRARMLQAELQLQQLPLPARPPWPAEPWLLGPAASQQLDPQVWGWRVGRQPPITLASYTVSAARLRLTRRDWAAERQGSAEQGVAYNAGSGVWPRLWGARPAELLPGRQPRYNGRRPAMHGGPLGGHPARQT
jgi:hypothetical protein